MSLVHTALHIKNIGKHLFRPPGYLQDGDVAEFVGEQSTGKSLLMQDLMITCLIPELHGGCGCGVIYFDLDYHFDLLRLVAIIEQKTGASEEDIKLWLKNFNLLHCDSLEQVVITLHSLEPFITNSKVPFGMIILDSISSFFWIDAKNGANSYDKEENLRKVVEVLKDLKEQHRLTILASTQCLTQPDNESTSFGSSFKPFLCRQWQDFVKYQFVLSFKKMKDSSHGDNKIYLVEPIQPRSCAIEFLIKDSGVVYIKSLETKQSSNDL